jgi:hypothetical protein
MTFKPLPRHQVTQPLDTDYRFIPLTQNQVAIVDAIDYEWLSQWHWTAAFSKNTMTFYARCNKGRTKVYMHRLILGCKSGQQGDHRDHDTLNNRRTNLRICTHSDNMKNARMQRNNTSGFKGVERSGNKWEARICANRTRIYLGSFVTPQEAALAYNEAAKKYHGEFAVLNHP